MGTERVDLLSLQFDSDLVASDAFGACTTGSQTIRPLVSPLSSPVGSKNGTDGGVNVAVDASAAADPPHAFMATTKMGQAAVFETRGDTDCSVILRGGGHPNYPSEPL